MFDFEYQGQLKYLTITSAKATGDAERLAQTIHTWDAESDPTDYCDWPKFGGEATGPDFVISFDASELYDFEGRATWTCRVDLGDLDWSHPWTDSTITAAEAIYCQHRTTEPRWVLPHIASDAARFLRNCEADYTGLTPLDADKLLSWFLTEAMPEEAEENVNPDPIAALLDEAMEDAKPTSTGIPQLDALLGGGLHRGLSVLAGDPSSGKTALAVQLALFAANQQEGLVCYAMCDQGGAKSALLRMVSCAAAVAGVDGCELSRAGMWDTREVYQGRHAFDRVGKGRIELTDQTEISELISWLDFMSRTKGHVSFVALDFAQSMTYDARPLAFDPEAASQAVRELRAWAHAHNTVILLLSAYSKSASDAHARGAAPSMSDILGSAELAYSAESVLSLTNQHDGSGEVTARDLKHRHGNGKPCTLHLASEHGLFT